MTFDEFKKQLDGMLVWISKQQRPATAWWLSVEDYAKQEWDRAYVREHNG